jgi:hypothetical protein
MKVWAYRGIALSQITSPLVIDAAGGCSQPGGRWEDLIQASPRWSHSSRRLVKQAMAHKPSNHQNLGIRSNTITIPEPIRSLTPI